MNEKLCPELLVPMTEEIECMQEQLAIMDRNLNSLSSKDLRRELHQQEVNRIRYVLVSYFRTRLFKIQEFPWFIRKVESLRAPETPSKLTAQEHKFLKEYVIRTLHFKPRVQQESSNTHHV